jgi:taurine--2-oxoglutarate transaminase
MSTELIEAQLEDATAEGRSSPDIIQQNRDYALFSWSVQNAANPMHMKHAEGCVVLGWRR